MWMSEIIIYGNIAPPATAIFNNYTKGGIWNDQSKNFN